jgi:predicted sugar kinase
MADETRSPSRPARTVEVRAPARLHLGMLSFGDPAVRSFGGVGVMVDRPHVHVRLRRAEAFLGRGPLAERAVQFARDAATSWGLDARSACEIDVLATPRAHVGLGSGTQLALAVAAGMRQLYRIPVVVDEHPRMGPSDDERFFETADVIELAKAVGRGRRSCVGIHGFSRGGLIVEAGRFVPPPQPATGDEFSPMVARVRLPSAWRCVVIVQRDSIGLYGEPEKRAFEELPPVPRELAAELARVALMEMVPAAVEGRFAEFSQAVRRYGELAGQPFAPASVQLPHAASTAHLIELLGELGFQGVAQSSWGPAVMACCESLEAAGLLVERFDALKLLPQYEPVIAKFDAQGAVLRIVE